jgi:hypothetical protein
MNVNKDSQLSLRKYSTCILFLPSEVTTELVKTIADNEIIVTIHYYYQVTPSNTHHSPHMISHTSWIRTSNKERGNNCIYSYIKNIIKVDLIDHPIK